MAEAESNRLALRLDRAKWDEVDKIAHSTERSREAIVTEALDAYLELHRWQVAHIEEGMRQAREGEFASDSEIAKAFRREA